MVSDRVTGGLLLAGGAVGIILYGWLLFFFRPILILQLTAFIAASLILGIVGWIGYTMATTPPPEPIETSVEIPKGEKTEAKASEPEAEKEK